MESNNAPQKKRRSKKYIRNVKIRRVAYFVSSLLFVAVMAAGFTLSFDFPDRPKTSESEKRELAKFPEFSFSALASGDYFDGISLWFSDTYPFRDDLVSMSSTVKRFLGIGQSIHNFSENKADEIPEAESESQEIADVKVETPAQPGTGDLQAPALPIGEGAQGEAAQQQGDNVIEQKFDAIYIYGNTAYEYYNFVQSTADKYISAVNSAADSMTANGINVFNMIIPTSIDITLNESTRSKLNSSDQQNAINYMSSRMSSNVKTVALFDLLTAHKDEYIYFRTDHHWTSLGAYYAYAQYMTVKGGSYAQLKDFTEYSFPGFLGTFYNDTGKNSALAQNPDTVYAYMPPFANTFKMQQSSGGSYTDWPLICDATDYSQGNKYLCFIGGDNPLSLIENTDMATGDTCVLVKESFGNAFAPYLLCNYKYVYVIDYRTYKGDISDFAKEVGAKDVIIQNNVSMTRNASLVEQLNKVL